MEGLFGIEFVDESWDDFDRVLRLVYEVLYLPFGVGPGDDWYHEAPSLHAVATSGRHLLGSARLLGVPGEPSRQLRQVAVEPAVQRQGVGRALVESMERRAADEGTTQLWLYARSSAYPFYERLGYAYDSEEFLSKLTGVEHRKMIKTMGPRRS